MGKPGDVNSFSLPSTSLDAPGTTLNARRNNGCCCLASCCGTRKLVTCKCVLVLVLGVGVLLSAVFWLPFLNSGAKQDLDLEYAGYDIVASFMLKRPISFVKNNTLQLENDIFDEMSFPSTKVEILSFRSSPLSNTTKVVFAVESDPTTQSLIRASFVSFITRELPFKFSNSLFGDPFSFDILKFKGGITAAPHQNAYLLQSVQILFNFTLNYSMDEILNNFDELMRQLKMGLRLSPYENLYIRLTNLAGSTVAPPTTVRAQVLMAVGINPSKSRLKQLAESITGPHAKNLGLNNTVFGRVKQVSLSSILQHSLGNDTSSAPSSSPSPSPMPTPYIHNHHHHHHRHHHHVSVSPHVSPSPSIVGGGSTTGSGSPIITPAPRKNKTAHPPGCRFNHNRFPWNHKNHYPMSPSAAPAYAPHSQSIQTGHPAPRISPVSTRSPSPNVVHTHHQPPSHSEYHARHPSAMSLMSPALSPSSAATLSNHIRSSPLFILLGLCL